MPDPEPDIALREWAPFVYSPLIKRSFLKEVAFEECFGTVKGLNGRILSPRLVVPSALHPAPQPPVLHEEAAVQRRDRARSGHLDHTPSLIPSPVLLPHMTPSSVQLRKPPSRSPCCQIFTEARFSPSPHGILPTPAETLGQLPFLPWLPFAAGLRQPSHTPQQCLCAAIPSPSRLARPLSLCAYQVNVFREALLKHPIGSRVTPRPPHLSQITVPCFPS